MKSQLKSVLQISIGIIVLLMLSGCADHVTFAEAATREPVGFWYGLWHGMICPIAWIVSLFSDNVTIYAIYNNGGWYNFGFVLGVSGAFGGGISARPKK